MIFGKSIKDFKFRTFGKEERSSFPYWYYHWKAFQLVALDLGVWKLKYLFHDIEKPWMRLFCKYETVQKWHRKHNRHHSNYKGGLDKVDWLALIIDNECSRYTKAKAQMSAREYIEYVIYTKDTSQEIKDAYMKYAIPLLGKLGL